MIMRECRVCKTTKDINCFSTIKKNGNIYHLNKCKDCYALDRNNLSPELKHLKVVRNQVWRNANRDRWRANKREYRIRKLSELGIVRKTKEQITKDKEDAFKQRLINKLKHLIFLWRAKLKASYVLRIQKKYKSTVQNKNPYKLARVRNPIRKSEHNKRRNKVISNSSDGSINPQSIYNLYEQHSLCHYCSCALNRKNRTLDHVVPLSMGGKHILSNVVVSCFNCNVIKSNNVITI